MKTALIGHRGVGKSSLLNRIEVYYREAGRPVQCLDLDRMIEERMGRTVSDVFAKDGEEAFRRAEREIFAAIDRETAGADGDVFLALGAGFDPALISDEWKALWIRRSSDEWGRIFTDRPRLNAAVDPLTEFKERHAARQGAFRARADETLWLDEGIETADPGERAFFLGEPRELGGAITVRKEFFRTSEGFQNWLKQRLVWGVRWFELRDDLLNREQMEMALKLLPSERALISFRDPSQMEMTKELVNASGASFDWPLERGKESPVQRAPSFLSLHERAVGQSLKEALQRLLSAGVGKVTRLKAALPVHDFNELMEGHRWYLEDPKQRVFLPLSADGRWNWYREFIGEKFALNFFREDEGSGKDQPSLLRWIRRGMLGEVSSFAAVLGDPVAHSRTPHEHREFFERRKAPAFAIRVAREEWEEALPAMEELGLRWAAVTAPLKELAYKGCKVSDDLSCRLQALNTLVRREKSWQGMNTDHEGFVNTWRESVGPISMATAIWGGGGTLEMMRAILPKARLYSARTGEPRTSYQPEEFSPEVVVWAAGRLTDGQPMPPASWKPSIVFDLSYSEDSSGRAFALECGARYVSGLQMFRSQAAAQKRFWDACDGMAMQAVSSLRPVKGATQ